MSNHYDHPKDIMSKPSEKGQNLVILAVAMVALIGLLALVLDGGFSYAARRQAQNAADAGALAGANVLCGLQPGNAYYTAMEYAVTRNKADSAVVNVDTTVEVTATVTHDSFFAGIIGHDVVTTTAYAEAGCYHPCVASIFPVAWACKPPEDVGDVEYDVNTCNILYANSGDTYPRYVIMDTKKANDDYLCQDENGLPTGAIDCDIDGDGDDDLIIGGGRSWLDLSGVAGGTSDMVSLIGGTTTVDFQLPQWVLPDTGVKVPGYTAAIDRIGEVVALPVFNKYSPGCNPYPTDPSDPEVCDHLWEDGDIIFSPTKPGNWYRIASFSLFRITGVYVTKKTYGDCTATYKLIEEGFIDANDNTVEGYFIEGYIEGLSGKCTNDTGAVTIYLDH